MARRLPCLLLALAIAGAGCSKDAAPHPPSLANLRLSPTSVYQGAGGGALQVDFSVVLADPGADVVALIIQARDAAGVAVLAVEGSVSNPPGLTAGTLMGTLSLPTVSVGDLQVTFRARDSTGAVSSEVAARFAVETPPPTPTLAAVIPSAVEAGSPALVIALVGTEFDIGSTVLWNGSALATVYQSPTELQAQLGESLLAEARTGQIAVRSSAGVVSNLLTFTVVPAAVRPLPVLTSLSPPGADAGIGDLTLVLSGSDFHPRSQVYFGTLPLATTYVSANELRATIPFDTLRYPGNVPVTVWNPPPGGGVSAPLDFSVRVPAVEGVALLDLTAHDVVHDPYGQRLYVSVSGTSPSHPNRIAVVDPARWAVEATVPAGSEPSALAISDDGAYLYVAHGGASTITRFQLPGLADSSEIELGRDPAWGPSIATALAVEPGVPRTLAAGVASGPIGEVRVYDDGVLRSTVVGAHAALCWRAGTNELLALAANGMDLSTYPVSDQGLGDPNVQAAAFSGATSLAYEPSTGLLYGNDGRVLDLSSGNLVGSYLGAATMPTSAQVVDPSLGRTFFAAFNSSGGMDLRPYELESYVQLPITELRYLDGFPVRVVRYGANGVAMLSDRRLILLHGPAVLPPSATDNPAPTLSGLSPATVPAGSGNLRLTLAGTGFVPGAVARVGGVDRFTTRRSATQLVAHLPASELAVAGTLEVVVVNPTPGGGASAAMTLTVGP